jgi:PhoPQ-activated pathogenicity-related protein
MISTFKRWSKGILVLGLLATLGACAHLQDRAEANRTAGLEPTALDRYVAAPDPAYTYKLANTIQDKEKGYTAYVIDMTSQTWRSAEEVDHPVWKHWVTVIKPDEVKSDTGLLFITGGSINQEAPEKIDPMLVAFATASKTVVTELRQIPNEPLVFADEGKRRTEDAIIAYTWDKYLKTGDETWPLRLPMTKAAVRAMDTVTSFMATPEAGNVPVTKFVVAGGSKRGWTTWTTAAVDKRVVAIAPFVIDMLNLQKSFKHHYRAYGFWAPAVGDYTAMGLMNAMGKPGYDELMKIVEPYEYRGRYTIEACALAETAE